MTMDSVIVLYLVFSLRVFSIPNRIELQPHTDQQDKSNNLQKHTLIVHLKSKDDIRSSQLRESPTYFSNTQITTTYVLLRYIGLYVVGGVKTYGLLCFKLEIA